MALAAEKAEQRRIDREERLQLERLLRLNIRTSLLDSLRVKAPPLLIMFYGAAAPDSAYRLREGKFPPWMY